MPHILQLTSRFLPGGRGTPYNSLYGKTPPERGTFFSGFRVVYERVEILLVEVYKRVGKYVI